MKARWLTLALFVAALAFYLYTLQPGLSWGDGARLQHEAVTGATTDLVELSTVQFAADPYPFARLGVAAWDHPVYIILGYTLTRLLPAVEPLWLVNAISAVFAAAALAVLFRLCEIHTRSISAALAAALMLGVSHTYWFHASTPEVYSLFAFLLLLNISLFEAYERTGRFAALAGSAFVLGLGGANHLLAFLALPGAALYWLPRNWPPRRPALRPGQLAWLGLAFAVGFAPWWIQLIRILRTVSLAEAAGPVLGSLFLRGSVTLTPLGLAQSFVYYLMFLALQFGPVGLAVGLVGFAAGRRDFPVLWPKVVSLYVVYTLFGVVYRVTDQFAFLQGSHLFWALAIGLGAARLLSTLAAARRRWLLGGLGLSIVVMPLFYQAIPGLARAVGLDDEAFGIPEIGTGVRDGLNFYLNPNKHGDDSAERFGRETLMSLPPQAMILAEYYTDTDEYFVLRYLVLVAGLRPDVEIVGWPLENPFSFDSNIALGVIEAEVERRPVFLASLDERYYAASTVKARYCVVPEANLYRVYPASVQATGHAAPACLP